MIAKVESPTTNALPHAKNDDRFEDRRLARIWHDTSKASSPINAKIPERSGSTHLVRVEDVVLCLYDRVASVAAV
jgi:hypothetical protein